MPTLQEISEQGAAAAERCVRESIEMDYAYKTGNLKAWIDRKYAKLIGDSDGDSRADTGANRDS